MKQSHKPKETQEEFEKIKQLNKVYLGHENTTLGGEKSCAVVYPMWSDNVPNVLKFSKSIDAKDRVICNVISDIKSFTIANIYLLDE